MSISAHAVRRAVVAVAASGAAVLSMTAASAAAHHERGLAGTPICSVARLRVSVGQGSGTAGAVVYPLRFTNLTRVTCHLNGYPGVAAVGRHGHQLGSPASRDTLFRPRFVTLRRGATAHADLTIEEAGNFPSRACRVRTAVGLRVYPPASRGAAFVRLTFAACSRRGPSYLHVTAVHRGRG
ncbi:MAG: DUF4232 domain-containing protein [Streptosporangiales bacterium]